MDKFGFHTTAEEVVDLYANEIKGKNVLVTGTSLNGLGAETALQIAKYANLVIITGYNAGRLQLTEDAIKKDVPHANIRKLNLDLSTMATTRKAAAEVLAYPEPLHVLINNAAAAIGEYKVTSDGFESQFATDHINPFIFTNLILPKIRASKTENFLPRIIYVSSSAHAFGGGIHWDDLKFKDGAEYERWTGYSQCKTANILIAGEMARRLKGEVLLYSLHPGLIWTNIVDAIPSPDMIRQGMVDQDGRPMESEKWHWKTVPQGAATQVLAAFAPEIADQSGSYLDDCQIHNDRLEPYAADPANATRLWKLTEKLIGEEFPL